MSPETLMKRGVRPLGNAHAAMVQECAVTFCHRGGYGTLLETSLASKWQLVHSFSPAHGILITVDHHDLQKLVEKEAGYTLKHVAALPYGSNETVLAQTFISEPMLLLYKSVVPSRRYMNLLLSASSYLDDDYVKWLKELSKLPPTAETCTCPAESVAKAFVFLASSLLVTLLYLH